MIDATETVDLSRASGAFVDRIARSLYAVHDRIFSGVSEEQFARHVFHSDAELTRVRVYRDERGALVGYAVVHRFRRRISGRTVSVFRGEAGLLPEVRGHGTIFYFYTLEFLRYRLRHLLEPIFYLGMLVHPSSYVLCARYFLTYPSARRETPAAVQRLMEEISNTFPAPPVSGSDTMVRRVGWTTRAAETWWRDAGDPDVDFFVQRNPGYREGHGLVVLVPLTTANLLRALARYTVERLERRFKP